MSGKINHTFELKDQEIPNVTDSPNQITHDITDALIVANVPVNGNAKPFNGNVTISRVIGNVSIGIGGNVYILPNIAHRTIQVSEITRITTPFNSTFRTGTAYKPFVQKYFEYSGKIYVNEWSSRIHWYTFYNPENYMVPRDPTQQDVKTGGFDIGSWALNKRKINMYIGRITLGNITIKPPPFSIDMQKTAVTGGDKELKRAAYNNKKVTKQNQTGRVRSNSLTNTPKVPSTNSGETRRKSTSNLDVTDSAKPFNNEKIQKNVNDLLGLFKTNGINEPNKIQELFKMFLQKILDPITNKTTDKKRTGKDSDAIEALIKELEKRVELSTETLAKIRKSQIPKQFAQFTETSIQKYAKLREPINPGPEIAFRMRFSGTLETETRTYDIHHTFYLSSVTANDNTVTYTISKVKSDSNDTQNHKPKGSTTSLYIGGEIQIPFKDKDIPPFIVNIDDDKLLKVDKISFTSKQSIQAKHQKKKGKKPFIPTLTIKHIHIYSGDDKPITKTENDEPIYFVNINGPKMNGEKKPVPISLYTETNSESSRNSNIICDFESVIKIDDPTATQHTNQKVLHLNGVVVDETPQEEQPVTPRSAAKITPRKRAGKTGGHKTRRFRQ